MFIFHWQDKQLGLHLAMWYMYISAIFSIYRHPLNAFITLFIHLRFRANYALTLQRIHVVVFAPRVFTMSQIRL